jgi:N6-adenosine-specific RNA methylase IME4
MIEGVSPWPRLELFGRDKVAGWTVWGDQVERTLSAPSSEYDPNGSLSPNR